MDMKIRGLCLPSRLEVLVTAFLKATTRTQRPIEFRCSPSRSNRVVAAGIASLAAVAMLRFLSPGSATQESEVVIEAARIMEKAIADIRDNHPGTGIDLSIDPNKTGLIGPESSPLMTTLGQLEAKRSSTNPNMAGLIVRMLDQAGVGAGDTIAIGSSGSFPALLVASLSAAKAMNAHAVSILSLGASSYGATDTEYDLLDIYAVLQRSGVCSESPAAVSLGGEKDIGLDFEPGVRERLTQKIRDRGNQFIYEPDLEKNVSERIKVYQRKAEGRISAFINSGGGYANLGTSELALKLSPGLNLRPALPPVKARGVLFEMASGGTPVIHLLHIKGLMQKYSLPWDPIPLPPVGNAKQSDASSAGSLFWAARIAYFGLILCLLAPLRLRGGFLKTHREGAKARKI